MKRVWRCKPHVSWKSWYVGFEIVHRDSNSTWGETRSRGVLLVLGPVCLQLGWTSILPGEMDKALAELKEKLDERVGVK